MNGNTILGVLQHNYHSYINTSRCKNSMMPKIRLLFELPSHFKGGHVVENRMLMKKYP